MNQLGFDYNKRPTRTRESYFNTTAMRGAPLRMAVDIARDQDVTVLAIMRGRDGPMGPSEVWRTGKESGVDWLLTSVRRSMNTLTRDGKLDKTVHTRTGYYGRPERLWRATR